MNHVGEEGEKMSGYYKAKLNELGFELVCHKAQDYFTEDRVAIAVRTDQFTILETKFINLNDAAKLFDDDKRYTSWGNQSVLC